MNYLGGMVGGTGDGTAATYKGTSRAMPQRARSRFEDEWQGAFLGQSCTLFVPSVWSAIERSTLEYPE